MTTDNCLVPPTIMEKTGQREGSQQKAGQCCCHGDSRYGCHGDRMQEGAG